MHHIFFYRFWIQFGLSSSITHEKPKNIIKPTVPSIIFPVMKPKCSHNQFSHSWHFKLSVKNPKDQSMPKPHFPGTWTTFDSQETRGFSFIHWLKRPDLWHCIGSVQKPQQNWAWPWICFTQGSKYHNHSWSYCKHENQLKKPLHFILSKDHFWPFCIFLSNFQSNLTWPCLCQESNTFSIIENTDSSRPTSSFLQEHPPCSWHSCIFLSNFHSTKTLHDPKASLCIMHQNPARAKPEAWHC